MLPNLQPGEMIVVMLVAVLLFGKRLPEVGRSLGKGIIEFKKGLRGVDDEDETPVSTTSRRIESTPAVATVEPSVPKFEPPTAAPTIEVASSPQPYAD
jgi:sec-independent protein translocase protein TatA